MDWLKSFCQEDEDSDLWITNLVDTVENFATPPLFLTATDRLTDELRRCDAALCLNKNQTVWVKPSIFSFPNWLKTLWGTLRTTDSHLLLSSVREQTLWEQVIQSSQFTAENAAKLASQAFALMMHWQIPFPFPHSMMTPAIQCFQGWVEAFQEECRRHHWLTLAQLPFYLSEQFKQDRLIVPKKITLVGFDEINPSYQALLVTLSDLGTVITQANKPADLPLGDVARVEFDDVETEIITMAMWAKQALAANPDSLSIGCVVPKLEQRRTQVLKVFNRLFEDDRSLFALSAPLSLNHIPLIGVAWQYCAFAEKILSKETLRGLLRTPFIPGANSEVWVRARLIYELNDLAADEIALDQVLALANQADKPYYCPLWYQHVSQAHVQLVKLSLENQLPSYFADQFAVLLRTLGWPGEQGLTDEETMSVQRFLACLQSLASLDLMGHSFTWSQAKAKLHQIVKQTLFQPQLNQEAPIQIMGLLEPLGLSFTQLWVLGLHDEVWPALPRPHPFIPLELQTAHDLPHASFARELRFSSHLTQQFCQMAKVVIFSSTRCENDNKQHASRLLQPFSVILPSELVRQKTDEIALDRFEYFTDDNGPKLPESIPIKGGVKVLEWQAACPFRAFITLRLHAKRIETQGFYLSEREKGSVLHHSLELIWKTLQNQQNLLNQTHEKTRQLIESSVFLAMHALYQKRGHALTPALDRIEQQRCVDLISKWLFTIEAKREAFSVVATELSSTVHLGARELKISVDRVDAIVSHGKRIMIDYKTGLTSKEDWFGDRPNQPQLPLYCVTSQVPISGIVFAQLKNRLNQQVMKGLAEEGVDLNGIETLPTTAWSAQQSDWKMHLEKLMHEFVNGCAKVDPKEGKVTCQFCHLQMVCRVEE